MKTGKLSVLNFLLNKFFYYLFHIIGYNLLYFTIIMTVIGILVLIILLFFIIQARTKIIHTGQCIFHLSSNISFFFISM